MFLALLFFALAARDMYGKEYGAIAAILLLGCVHLQVTAHKLITDVALFAGFSIALYGFTLSTRRRTAGGFWIGTGTGIGFLSKGLLAPGLPVLFRQWRRKDYGVSFAVALAAVLPWVVIWPPSTGDPPISSWNGSGTRTSGGSWDLPMRNPTSAVFIF
jgi:4-amino-4-deoxy-L-arabinose transferase-like glycosyltransferase